MHVLQGSVAERSGEYLCVSNGRVQDLGSWAGCCNFAWSWRIWADVGVKIARGSSLARISLPCGAAVVMLLPIWLVETIQVILLGARRVGTGQIVEQAGRLPD